MSLHARLAKLEAGRLRAGQHAAAIRVQLTPTAAAARIAAIVESAANTPQGVRIKKLIELARVRHDLDHLV